MITETHSTALRRVIEDARDDTGMPLKDFTVLSASRDPYRLDTPANHLLGKWLEDAYAEVNPAARRVHLRGLHYMLVGRVEQPDGTSYVNDDETWIWLQEKAAKAARYLGYLPWEALRDARNSPPQIFTDEFKPPEWRLSTGDVELYLPETLEPRLKIEGDLYRQPYRQVVIAEKQGVEDLLLPVCRARQATLALPAGEVSDTMLFELLAAAAADERPLVIHQLGDFDPAGWQMAVSTSRTVQALVDTQFPGMKVLVHPVALTKANCVDWDLPSSPLKATERRADRWRAAMGREQTELDAAVATAPDELAAVVNESLLMYFDKEVSGRSYEMQRSLEADANRRLAAVIDPEVLANLRREGEARITELDELVDEVNAALTVDPEAVGIDMPDTPDIIYGDVAGGETPLLDTVNDWAVETRRLKARKDY